VGPSVDYSVVQTITNDTGETMTDFQFAFGCGGAPYTSPCQGFSPLRLDDSTPTSSVGGTESSNSFSVLWTGLDIPSGSSATFTFGVDTCAGCSGQWQIIQEPSLGSSTAPEPESMILGGIGLALTFAGRIRRRRC
jgi:PEP-CTERM motif